MRLAEVSWIISRRGTAADFTACGNGKDTGRGFVILQDVFSPNVLCGENRNKRRGGCGFLDAGTAVRFFAFDQAHYAGDFESELTGGVDSLNRGRASGANIVHD